MTEKEFQKIMLKEKTEFCALCEMPEDSFYAYKTEKNKVVFVCEKCKDTAIGKGKLFNFKEIKWKLIHPTPIELPEWN